MALRFREIAFDHNSRSPLAIPRVGIQRDILGSAEQAIARGQVWFGNLQDNKGRGRS